ncbi:MAG: lipoyl(octanoyl) transferase LipB [Planctomycetota bacterium]
MTDFQTSATSIELVVRDLGDMPYATAFALQKELQRRVIEARPGSGAPIGVGGESGRPMYLLLVEHVPPVITMTRRGGVRQHLVAGAKQLAAAGVEVAETDRGGDVTYHGPGQLVAYPILDLNVLGFRLHDYMRFLEQVAIDTLARFGIAGRRDPSAPGVWYGEGTEGLRDEGTEGGAAKICAMGVRISRWVSMHGLALNVTTDLRHFDLIVPCGLTGRAVTSIERELGDGCPSMDDVKRVFVERFRAAVAGRTG